MARSCIPMFLSLVILVAACNPYQSLYSATTVAPAITEAAPTPISTSQLIIKPSTPQTCTVTTSIPAGYLNIRAGPGVQYEGIDILREGQVLTLTGDHSGNWIEVTVDHSTGWINSKYCN